MVSTTSPPHTRFRKSGSRIPDCCRLALEVDSAKLLEEFRPELWPDGDFKNENSRSKFFVIGRPEFGTPDEPLPVLEELPYTRHVIELVPGIVRRGHFSVLQAGDALTPHKDGSKRFELFDATLRLHVPVVTSDAASMFVNGRASTG